MSFNNQAEARKEAEKIRRKLRSKGWTILVWDNLGWTFSLKLGHFNLYPNGLGGFFVLVSMHQRGVGGVPEWTHGGAFTDPNQAVKASLAIIDKDVEERTGVLRVMNRLARERK